MAKHGKSCTTLAGVVVALILLPATDADSEQRRRNYRPASEARAVPDGIRWVRDSAEFGRSSRSLP
jgi:hypothetical protein